MFDDVSHPLVFLSDTWHPVGGRFYCPVCISLTKPPAPLGWSSRSDVVSHLEGIHKWEAPEPTDVLNSKELTEALTEWRKDLEITVDDFGGDLRLVRGVDDFLSECEAA